MSFLTPSSPVDEKPVRPARGQIVLVDEPPEAVRTCQACEQTYIEAGYELVALPLAGVAERVAFVLDACGL